MYEFLWFLILIASLLGAFNCLPAGRPHREAKPIDDTWREKVWRCLAWTWRWWLVVAVLVLVAGVYLANNGMRAGLDLLLFFRRHWIWMTVLLVISLLGFVLAWRDEWTVRRLIGTAALSAAVTLLLKYEWYCLFISLLLLALWGLLLIQSERLPRLRWVGALLTTFLAAGLLLSRVLYDPAGRSLDAGDYVLIGVVVTVTALGLIWARQTQSALLGWVCGLMLVLLAGGLALSKFGKNVPTWFAGVADYVLIVILLVLAFSAVVWVRSLHMQPLGWVSVTMILFLGSGLFFSDILYGEPEDFADIEEQFKYGSVGSDHFMTRGIPYFIWEVLPEMFPPEKTLKEVTAKLPEKEKVNYAPRYGKTDRDGKPNPKGVSYEAFGLVKEEDYKPRLVGQDKGIQIDRPIGFSKRKVFGMDFIGMNCAFCHVSTIRKDDFSEPKIILGMPANTADIELFFLFMFGVAEEPDFHFLTALTGGKVMNKILETHDKMQFGRQVAEHGINGVCQEIKNSIHRLSYRLALIPLTGRYMRLLEKQFSFIDPNYSENDSDRHLPRFGPGRVETWGPAKATLVTPPLRVPHPGGIVDYPAIWNQKAREGMRFHWDGSIDVLQERNIIAGLVVSGPNKECLDTERLDRIKNWLDGRPAPRFDDFVPRDQLQERYRNGDELYGSGDKLVNIREQGRVIFQHWCASCHAPDGDRIGRVEPFAELQTDRYRAESFTVELAEGLNKLKTDSWRLKSFKSQHGYVNVLLDGIWLRAPYLHNGSVPTLWDLLQKPDKRPAKFYRGNDVYDWDKVGFVSKFPDAEGRKFFKYDTVEKGNSNGGHLYGTDLSPDQKQALIEYLKTL